MNPNMKPMLADPAKLDKLVFPLLASPKLDGIRALVQDRKLLSRSKKLIPNRYIQSQLALSQYEGLDGELIVGPPNAPDTYRVSESGVMTQAGEPDFTYWVFDMHDRDGAFFPTYHHMMTELKDKPRIQLLRQQFIQNLDELEEYEIAMLAQGFEGVMLRRPQAPYKFGRATVKEGYLLKLKRFESSEFVVVGVEPLMHNANKAETNELGRTERSSAAEGLVARETMGTVRVRDIHHGWEFNIGTGFTAKDRLEFWRKWHAEGFTESNIYTYNYMKIGMKDVPRVPSYKGPRKAIDIES